MSMAPVIRTCIVCRQKRCKQMLSRFSLVDNSVSSDVSRNHLGRGVYLCKECEAIYSTAEENVRAGITKRMLFSLLNKKKK